MGIDKLTDAAKDNLLLNSMIHKDIYVNYELSLRVIRHCENNSIHARQDIATSALNAIIDAGPISVVNNALFELESFRDTAKHMKESAEYQAFTSRERFFNSSLIQLIESYVSILLTLVFILAIIDTGLKEAISDPRVYLAPIIIILTVFLFFKLINKIKKNDMFLMIIIRAMLFLPVAYIVSMLYGGYMHGSEGFMDALVMPFAFGYVVCTLSFAYLAVPVGIAIVLLKFMNWIEEKIRTAVMSDLEYVMDEVNKNENKIRHHEQLVDKSLWTSKYFHHALDTFRLNFL